MIKENSILIVLLLTVAVLSAQERQLSKLHLGWKFARGQHPEAIAPDYTDSTWQDVTVPHDWAVAEPFVVDGDGYTGKLSWKGQGWYRRNLRIPATQYNKRFYLLFDGVMAFPKVYINGQLAGSWDYGYNSFYLDITDLVQVGHENLITVHADTRKHDSRWYPGAGIYRKVQLLTVHPVHTEVWGTYVFTPIVKPHYADVRVRTSVRNAAAKGDTVRIAYEILSPAGEVVAEGEKKGWIPAGNTRDMEATLTLPDPQRWDIDHPTLYTLRSHIYVAGERTDRVETPFGVRTLRFDPDHGFYLNDRRVQLKGVNLHHCNGPLGAALYPRALERKLQIMKDMGVNAIRNSHNIASPEFLDLADRMGLLVFNEIFDKYDGKAGITANTDFEDFAHRNIRNFVRRDRNHPSVFLWSVGNEIGDVQWNIDNGFQRLHTMLNYVDKYDPTRPVTLVNDNWQSARMRHFDYYDVHAWNYDRRYRLARQLEPNKSVIISESASTLSTRGHYELPLPKKPTDFTGTLQMSSYDLHAPYWAEIADDDFKWQQQEPYIAGEFVWTGFDYLGEPTPYGNRYVRSLGMEDEAASRSSYFGIVDLVGLPKDRYYLYKSYWKPEDTTIHILPHWNWEDQGVDTVPVFVYTNGDCAELFLNGRSLGRRCKQPKADSSVYRFRLIWEDIVYEPGELRAVAYKAGQRLGETFVRTAGPAKQLNVSADQNQLRADGMDLSFIVVEAQDADGYPAPLADGRINVSVQGPGRIAGVGNGNPQSFNPFQASYVDLFYGKAVVIIRSTQDSGPIRVTLSSNELGSETIELRAD